MPMQRPPGARLSPLLAVALGCAACGDPPGVATDEPSMMESRSRPLVPPILVADDGYVGRSIAVLVETETAALSPGLESTYAGCLTRHAADEAGNLVAVQQHCVGHWQGLWLFETDTRATRFVFLDDDDDDTIDAFLDAEIGGRLTEDDNHDGAIDRLTESFHLLGPDYAIEGYGADWIPPAYPGERQHHDTDYDGYYDLEVIVGGEDPSGEPTFWRRISE